MSCAGTRSARGIAFVTDSTMVFVTEFDASGKGGYGCFVVPNGDFTITRDLQSFAPHTILTSDERCPGYGTPVGGGEDVIYAGGNSGLVLPMSVYVTWASKGAVSTFTNSSTLECLDYNESGSSTNQSTGAGAGSRPTPAVKAKAFLRAVSAF